MSKRVSWEKAQQLDQSDPLAPFRSRFEHTENEIYLDGNSLGKLPLQVVEKINTVVQAQWGKQLIGSWNSHWLALPKRLSTKIAQLLGANSNEITVGESTSVNLYKLIHALLASDRYPKQLITDELNFPTDNYILEGLSSAFAIPAVRCIEYGTDLTADLDRLKNNIAKTPGIICLSLVCYKSAYRYPIKILNAFAKAHNSIIVWDLSHAVGAIAIDFKDTQTLAAIGCTYKYLNGGPGAPAFLYVAESLQEKLNSPIQGWFGHAKPFDFSPHYEPAKGIQKFDAGTPPILSLTAMEIGIDLTLEAGTQAIEKKSIALGEFLIQQIETELIPLGYQLESPKKAIDRGAHISISHEESWRICQCLLYPKGNEPKIIPDFRPDRYIRLGMAPLYIGYEDIWQTVQRLKTIVETKEFLAHDGDRPTVT